MANLKALRIRIDSVKSTQKITSAMKLVSASKLRRAQIRAEAARPYAERMQRMLATLAASAAGNPSAPPLLVGNGRDATHLIIAVTADRGLAGAFNTNVGRAARTLAQRLEAEGKKVKIAAIGRKGRDFLRRDHGDRIIFDVSYAGRKQIEFADAEAIAARVIALMQEGAFDVCTLVYNRFVSVISQVATEARLIPAPVAEAPAAAAAGVPAVYEFEPEEEALLAHLLPQNLAVQIYKALIESAAGEQGARMTAMDNATRNAGDMIKRLTLVYNRSRQANITRELIEIISGAEAV
jgi:F-type H+-transporting ATPase subunit gamma